MAGGQITALEAQKRNPNRVNVFVDDEYAFSLSIDEAARLHKGDTLTEAEIATLRDQDEVAKAVDVGLRFLAARPRSTAEVRRRMGEKALPAAAITAALERLATLGYLDDAAFAAFWVRERLASKPISPRALRYELRQKGLDADIIDAALADLDAADAAYRAAETGARRLRGRSRREFHDQLVGQLARKGFSYSQARTAIQQVIDELPDDYLTDDPPTSISRGRSGGLQRSPLGRRKPIGDRRGSDADSSSSDDVSDG